ncbi:MAG: outer membrane protein transport protein [SAR324 cluster bacterium]|nr:outer membrane protein transport protein [SAR324 cluster bacterium]
MDVRKTGLLILGLFLFSGLVWGNGYHTAVTDTASLGQATGGITKLESSSTAQDLPAAMTFLESGIHVMGGVLVASPQFTFKGEDGKDSTKIDPAEGIFVSVVKNFGNTAIGISQGFPFNNGLDWGEDFVGRRVISKVDLSIGNTSPVFAYRFGKISFGAGVDIYEGNVNLQRVALTINKDNEVRTELGGTGKGTGFNASFFLNDDQFSFGIQHHSPFTLHAGDAVSRFDTSDELAVQFSSTFPDGGVSADLLLPSVTRFGFSVKNKAKDPDYLLELTITRTGWSNYRELKFDFKKPVAGSKTSVSPKNWHDTTSSAISGNYVFSRKGNNNMRVRAGMFSEPSPIPKDTLDGVTPDTTRLGYAVGFGMKRNRIMFDLAYLTENFPEGSSTLEELPGKYSGHAQVFSASVGYHW